MFIEKRLRFLQEELPCHNEKLRETTSLKLSTHRLLNSEISGGRWKDSADHQKLLLNQSNSFLLEISWNPFCRRLCDSAAKIRLQNRATYQVFETNGSETLDCVEFFLSGVCRKTFSYMDLLHIVLSVETCKCLRLRNTRFCLLGPISLKVQATSRFNSSC